MMQNIIYQVNQMEFLLESHIVNQRSISEWNDTISEFELNNFEKKCAYFFNRYCISTLHLAASAAYCRIQFFPTKVKDGR